MKLLLRGGRVIDPAGGTDAVMDVLLEDGRVARMAPGIDAPQATVLDAGGLVVCPGLVDMHVHLRDPGLTHKETIPTGRAAAAAGGFTAVACMPNTKPVADNAETIRYILDAARTPGSRVLPIGALTLGEKGETLTDARALREAGAVALSDDGMPVQSAQVMRRGLQRSAEGDFTVLSHCEDAEMVKNYAVNEGRVSEALGIPGRPAIAEELMVCRDALLARETLRPVHICHVSTAGSVEFIRQFKARGVSITCETCPQYFSLTEEEVLKQGTMARVNPPLRTPADVAAIIAGLRDGTIDAIATDHAPHAKEEKALSLTEAPSGMVGLETALGVALTYLYHTGRLDLPELLTKLTVNPAAILNVPYGRLAEGLAADVTVFDPGEEWTVEPERFRSMGRNTPYGGHRLKGKVKYTIVDGQIVYQG